MSDRKQPADPAGPVSPPSPAGQDVSPGPAQGPAEGASPGPAQGPAEVPVPPRLGLQERLVAGVLIAAIAAAVVFMGWYLRRHASVLLPRALQPWAQKVGMMEGPHPIKVADPAGSPTALVKAVVIMEHCLEPVQDLLVDIATQYPDCVRAEFYGLYSGAAQQVLQDKQESCAGLFVNNRNRFEVTSPDGTTRSVYFHGMPGPDYRLSDVVAVLKQEIVAAGGTMPADFDQRIQVREPSGGGPLSGGAGPPGGPATPQTVAP